MEHYNLTKKPDADLDPTIVLDRLSARFGEEAMRPLVERFAIMLGEAVASLDADDGVGIAHRVAGVAGTLGFADLGRRWLALADGDTGSTVDLRAESRRALAMIDARYGTAPPV